MSIYNISPIDGRYTSKTKSLQLYFSEAALIKYRLQVEVAYLLYLKDMGLGRLAEMDRSKIITIQDEINKIEKADILQIKEIEKTTNHDIKAVEYFLKEKMVTHGLGEWKEFVHFGLTSQDINNTAIPMSIQDAMKDMIEPAFAEIIDSLSKKADEWNHIPMLAHTHGQPASPTKLGKEIQVFVNRLENQLQKLKQIKQKAKFGGATGNMNAHFVAYPDIDWHKHAEQFVKEHLNLERAFPTTQIEHYDTIAELCHCMTRLNTILIDFSRDIWSYISMGYFGQRTIKGEIGSSAMPHKVNPIDFENAEGNLGVANALFLHLAIKLPVSRLQRDLTDSTVLRNIGVPMAHSLISLKSLEKGINKIYPNEQAISVGLDANWAVMAEAIQTVLRAIGYDKPYETLKELTRGTEINKSAIENFINQLDIDEKSKNKLRNLSPHEYVGK